MSLSKKKPFSVLAQGGGAVAAKLAKGETACEVSQMLICRNPSPSVNQSHLYQVKPQGHCRTPRLTALNLCLSPKVTG